MSVVKNTSEYTITKRRDGRYSVVNAEKNPVNGDEKVKILLAEDLIKIKSPAPPAKSESVAEEEPAAEEAAGDGKAEE